jgi:crossover junction endodeoxyribonuclease RuvC
MKNIMGVDIGMSGAISFYDGAELLIYDMPIYKADKGNELDVLRISDIIRSNQPTFAHIEKAILMPVNGKKSYQKLGEAQGVFKGILCALKIPYTFTPPRTWKAAMKCPADKGLARMRASELFPNDAHQWLLKKHDGRAESAIIALYGFRDVK